MTQYIGAESIDTLAFVSPLPTVAKLATFGLISPLVKTQVPAFVRDEHQRFIDFLQSYYEWTESVGNPVYAIKKLLTFEDIDTTTLDLISTFSKEYLVNIPDSVLADKRNLVKNIKEYYRARGTEKSFRLFFRILFGEEIEFYYPQKDMLRVSDGKWVQPTVIKIVSVFGNPALLKGSRIRGQLSNAAAFIENVTIQQYGAITTYELKLNPSSIFGQFQNNETISNEDESIGGRVSPILRNIILTAAGEGYSPGDQITITSVIGLGAKAVVESVTNLGAIKKLQVLDFGVEYQTTPVITFPVTATTATGTPDVYSIAKYKGQYINDDGHLDSSKVIQDSYFYQLFSYLIYSNQSSHLYKEVLLKQLHPAGFQFFAGVKIHEFGSLNANRRRRNPNANYLNVEIEQEMMVVQGFFKLGPSYRSIERNKFTFIPHEGYDSSLDGQGSNLGYNDSELGNTQIKDFPEFTIGDFDDLTRKTNILPDIYFQNDINPGDFLFAESIGSDEDFTLSPVYYSGILTEEEFGEILVTL